MIVKMAWKNIWRNKLRSSVVIVSIVLGLWAAAFIFAYVFGIMEQRLNKDFSISQSNAFLWKKNLTRYWQVFFTFEKLFHGIEHAIVLGSPDRGVPSPAETLVVEELRREGALVAPSLAWGRDQTVTWTRENKYEWKSIFVPTPILPCESTIEFQ